MEFGLKSAGSGSCRNSRSRSRTSFQNQKKPGQWMASGVVSASTSKPVISGSCTAPSSCAHWAIAGGVGQQAEPSVEASAGLAGYAPSRLRISASEIVSCVRR